MDASGYDKVSVGDLCTQYSAKAIPGQMDFSKVQDKLEETVGGYVEKERIATAKQEDEIPVPESAEEPLVKKSNIADKVLQKIKEVEKQMVERIRERIRKVG